MGKARAARRCTGTEDQGGTHGTSRTSVAGEAVLFELYDEDTAGWWPPCLGESPGPQERMQRHTVEQIIETFVPVPMLDVPVPQTVDQLVDVSVVALSMFLCRRRQWLWHGSAMLLAITWSQVAGPNGGSTGGSRAHDTSSGPPGGTHRQPRAA